MPQISITNETKRFKEHLSLDNNSRIIFSGPFGTGKSYFLKSFFEDNPDKYFLLRINPIHYSISVNEDILELIKYDLLFQLLEKDVEIEQEQFNQFITLHYYLLESSNQLVDPILKMIPKIGNLTTTLISKVDELLQGFNKFKKEIENDTQTKIINYLKTIANKKGQPYEEDYFSILLTTLIENVKVKFPKKEVVLVVDDLDRIDPEHIFRLFNIFATRFDIINDVNKFEIDKLILICDINNIENIYYHKYGKNVDFNGYIDKYFSHEIFYFNNHNEIKETITNYLLSQKVDNNISELFNLQNKAFYSHTILKFIFQSFIESRCISIRNLTRKNHKAFNYKYKSHEFYAEFGKNSILPLCQIYFDYLVYFYGSPGALNHALIKAANHFENRHPYGQTTTVQNQILGLLIPVLVKPQFIFSMENPGKVGIYNYNNLEFKARFSAIRVLPNGDVFTTELIKENPIINKDATPIEYINIFRQIQIAFNNLLNNNFY